MTNVCILTSSHPPFDARIFHKQATSLASSGYHVELIVNHEINKTVNGVKIIGIDDVTSHLDKLANLPRFYVEAKKRGADIYHFHDPGLLPVGRLLAARTDASVVYDCHEQFTRAFEYYDFPPNVFNPVMKRAYPVMEMSFTRSIDAIIAATEWIEEDFQKRGHSNVKLVRNFPIRRDIDFDSREVIRHHEFVMVYLGTISHNRGIDVMLELLDNLRGHGIDAGLWLIGSVSNSTSKARLKTIIRERKLNDHVKWFGRIPHEDVFSYLHCADVGLALLDPGQYEYGVPTKVFEYMLSSIPVVASNTTANRRYIDNSAGYLVPFEDVEAIEDRILDIATNSTLRNAMGKAGYEEAKSKYTWESEKERLLALYEELV